MTNVFEVCQWLLKLEKLVLFLKKDYLSLIYGQYKEIAQKMEIIHFNKII